MAAHQAPLSISLKLRSYVELGLKLRVPRHLWNLGEPSRHTNYTRKVALVRWKVSIPDFPVPNPYCLGNLAIFSFFVFMSYNRFLVLTIKCSGQKFRYNLPQM